MRFSQSTHLLMFLSLGTLTSIIRTGLPIPVELIDLVNSVITFLSQMTLLRWLTFQLVLFDRSNNYVSYDVKMDGSVLEGKSSFKMCWGGSSLLNWIGVLILSLLLKLPPRKLEL